MIDKSLGRAQATDGMGWPVCVTGAFYTPGTHCGDSHAETRSQP